MIRPGECSYLLRQGEQLLPVGGGVVQPPVEHSHVGGQGQPGQQRHHLPAAATCLICSQGRPASQQVQGSAGPSLSAVSCLRSEG